MIIRRVNVENILLCFLNNIRTLNEQPYFIESICTTKQRCFAESQCLVMNRETVESSQSQDIGNIDR